MELSVARVGDHDGAVGGGSLRHDEIGAGLGGRGDSRHGENQRADDQRCSLHLFSFDNRVTRSDLLNSNRGACHGATGSVNVIYSDWYSPSTWDAETEFGVEQRTYTMSATSLTQEIIDGGVVLVYMRFVGINPEIVQLPFMVPDAAYSFSFRASATPSRSCTTTPRRRRPLRSSSPARTRSATF